MLLLLLLLLFMWWLFYNSSCVVAAAVEVCRIVSVVDFVDWVSTGSVSVVFEFRWSFHDFATPVRP